MVEHQTFNLDYLSSTLSEYTCPSEASLNSDIDAQIEEEFNPINDRSRR